MIFVNSDEEYIRHLKTVITNHPISNLPSNMSRYMHLKNAYRGNILISDAPEDVHSPMFVGTTVKSGGEIQASADWAVNRVEFFKNSVPSEVLTRVYSDPVNILVGDPTGFNPRDYIDIFPDNWWGSCAYLLEYSPKKLFTTLEMYLYYTKPVAVTDLAYEHLSKVGLDFVDAREYTLDRKGGLLFREYTRRSEAFDFSLEERQVES